MADLGRLWAGNVYGTNTGNIFVDLDPSDEGVQGSLRFLDNLYGLVIYDVTGSFDGSELKLEGEPKQAQPGIQVGNLDAQAILTPHGILRGTWTSELGTGGTFELHPHDLPPADPSKSVASPVPEQLHSARRSLNAIRLYADDVRAIAVELRKDFTAGRLIVTYNYGGTDTTKYYEEFDSEADKIGEIKFIKFVIQEPEAYGINKMAVVMLDAEGSNEVVVQGIYESWVIGKAESLARHLRRHEKSLVTNVRKFGLNLYQFIAIAMLILFPEIEPLSKRAAFAVIVLLLFGALIWAHGRYLPNVVVYMSPRKPTLFARAWPSIVSWVIASTASFVAAMAFYFLTK